MLEFAHFAPSSIPPTGWLSCIRYTSKVSFVTRLAEEPVAGERTVGISFESVDALRREFDLNLSNGGLFIATEDAYELRTAVKVRVSLPFASEHVILDGEGGECDLFGLYAVDDMGSGALFDMTSIGLPAEPNVKASIAAASDPAR